MHAQALSRPFALIVCLFSTAKILSDEHLSHLHELVALEDGCGLKYQLAVLDVVLERRNVGLAEGHELLKGTSRCLHVCAPTIRCRGRTALIVRSPAGSPAS